MTSVLAPAGRALRCALGLRPFRYAPSRAPRSRPACAALTYHSRSVEPLGCRGRHWRDMAGPYDLFSLFPRPGRSAAERVQICLCRRFDNVSRNPPAVNQHAIDFDFNIHLALRFLADGDRMNLIIEQFGLETGNA